MASFVEWGANPDDKKANKGGSGGQFLKLQAGGKYVLRLVSRPIRYLQHWEPIPCRSPGVDKDGNVRDPLMQMGIEPKPRYAIWVLNRNEGNKLQIVDFPPSLYEKFKDWKEAFGEEPGGNQGPEWSISLISGGSKKRVEYRATAGKQIPFTTEEMARIRAGVQVGENCYDLKAALEYHRRDNTPEEIRTMLAAKQAQPAAAVVAGRPGGTQEADFGGTASQAPVAPPSQPQQRPAAPQAFVGNDPLNF